MGISKEWFLDIRSSSGGMSLAACSISDTFVSSFGIYHFVNSSTILTVNMHRSHADNYLFEGMGVTIISNHTQWYSIHDTWSLFEAVNLNWWLFSTTIKNFIKVFPQVTKKELHFQILGG